MARFSWDPGSLDRFRRNLEGHRERLRKRLALGLEMWADGTVAEIRAELVRLKIYDQGFLQAATTRTAVQMRPGKLRITVYNPLEYASVVEWGRKPGFHPPLLPLVGWAGRKGIIKNLPRNISFSGEWAKKWAASGAILRNLKKGARKGGTGPSKPLDPEIHDLLIVRLIARKIFEKGTRARHPFSHSWERRARVFLKEVRGVIDLKV